MRLVRRLFPLGVEGQTEVQDMVAVIITGTLRLVAPQIASLELSMLANITAETKEDPALLEAMDWPGIFVIEIEADRPEPSEVVGPLAKGMGCMSQ